MRLRPSGEAGPIASSLAAFARYQQDAAWTWEHMALTRARAVAGDAALCRRAEEIVAAVLRRARDPARLLGDVAHMRRRIAAEHANPSPWDLRHRPGGLVDLEFTVQYLMLREAHRLPPVLCRATGEAIAALDAAGILPPEAARELGRALALLRHVQALLALLEEGAAQAAGFPGLAAAMLARGAGAIDFPALEADIRVAAGHVCDWWERLVAAPARALPEAPA
jgi:glutamate-ammonia-ligase adenylyltransferase